ncbi:MAG: thiamine pyrophosphate-dependent dehydrogenase E1 component subunit alpha [Oligoflexia bacterium]|nr:thiamine pyrophosphate-dependent dehydrogenase E1 component subunit alpha [Oligoflexia bacterium]
MAVARKPPLLEIYELMVKSRVLEERLIKIYKSGEGFFWIGGPGQEAFDVTLGMLLKKGQGLDYDWFHGHYRSTPVLIAMGLEMIDSVRMMKNLATDKSSHGRNFCNHYAIPEWNVAPISSPIEVQYSIALGTALAQKQHGGSGITVVTGGDAGTAESDFASCLVWASRPLEELPMLILVQDNHWGISTPYEGQHGEKNIADRGKAFGIKTAVIDGNDVEESWNALSEAFAYIRKEKKPYLLQANVSRLYGHSSASGANFVTQEADCIKILEQKLVKQKLLTESKIKEIWDKYQDESMKALNQARTEPAPTAESIWEYVYADNENADWRKF